MRKIGPSQMKRFAPVVLNLLLAGCAAPPAHPVINDDLAISRSFAAAEAAIVAQDFDAWWSMLSSDYIDFYSLPENYPPGYGIDDLADWFYTMKVEIREKYNHGKPLRPDYTVFVSDQAAVVYSVLASMAQIGWNSKPAAFFILEGGEWRYGTEREVRAAGWRPTPNDRPRPEGARD